MYRILVNANLQQFKYQQWISLFIFIMAIRSLFTKYRLKSEQIDSKKPYFLRLSSNRTQTQTAPIQSNRFNSSKIINHSTRKKFSNLISPNISLMQTPKSDIRKQLQYSSSTDKTKLKSQSPLRNKFDILKGRSLKSYDMVEGYGWCTLRKKEERNKIKLSFDLGRIKAFHIVQTENSNSQVDLQKQYLIQITNLLNRQQIGKVNEAKLIQMVSAAIKKYNIDHISLLTVLITSSDIVIFSAGQSTVLIYTKTNQLIEISQSSSPQKNLSMSLTKQSRQSSKFCCKIISSENIAWICPISSRINTSNSSTFIKNCVNKQFSLNSKEYSYGQAAMQSCKRIINQLVCMKKFNSAAIIVIFLSKYPFEIRTKYFNQNNQDIGSESQEKGKQKKAELTQSKVSRLRYVGKRSSFVKSKMESTDRSEGGNKLFFQKRTNNYV